MKLFLVFFTMALAARAVDNKPHSGQTSTKPTTTTPAPSLDQVVRDDFDTSHEDELFSSNENRMKMTNELIQGI